jgi:hypothetical protein
MCLRNVRREVLAAVLINACRACSRPARAFQGVKKPYNPIMGEVFHCKWDYGDKGSTLYIAEQVLARPPAMKQGRPHSCACGASAV